MRISPALSAKMKKGKKHTANGHAKSGNYPMGRKHFGNEYLIFKPLLKYYCNEKGRNTFIDIFIYKALILLT